jgi:hypothetical protein
MAAMKQYVYNHSPAIAAVGQFINSITVFLLIELFVGPVEQLREYNRTRSRMYTISH